MKQLKKSNILDPINQTLDPSVWDGSASVRPTLKFEHKMWIEKMVFSRFNEHGYDVQNWGSLYVTGSITTYQYSEDSDLDISLFVNSEIFPEWSRAEMIGISVEQLDGSILPLTTHPLQVFVVPEGVLPTDLYKKGLRSGYDILNDRWINPPDREMAQDPELIYNCAYTYALEQADKMERLLRYEPHKAKTFWHQIHKRRRIDQKAGKGDFAPSNLVYKMLANRGLLDQISESTGEYIAKTKVSDDSDWLHVAPKDYRESILKNGIQPNQQAGFSGSDFGDNLYTDQGYEPPVYLTRNPNFVGINLPNDPSEYDVWKVNPQKPLLADVGSLIEHGFELGDDGEMYPTKYTNSDHPELANMFPDDHDLTDLDHPGVIDYTGTAAHPGGIDPEHIELATNQLFGSNQGRKD